METEIDPFKRIATECIATYCCYLILFHIAPAIHDPTSKLRLRILELREEGRKVRFHIQEVRRFRRSFEQDVKELHESQ